VILNRRSFFKMAFGGAAAAAGGRPLLQDGRRALRPNAVYSITGIPDNPFTVAGHPDRHVGFEGLIRLMGQGGLKLYRTDAEDLLQGPRGLIAADDVVLIKINAQWKYRGATNSDLVRGIVQRILEHPDGFRGEVVLFENGQGRGRLNCNQDTKGYLDDSVHANAFNEAHTFQYLIEQVFRDPRVSAMLMDPYRGLFIAGDNHLTPGFRRLETVSYPCFTTARGNRVELMEGIWTGGGFSQNLKLINVPVLKTHEGSKFTGVFKHFYGILSMEDGGWRDRHYEALGETCGKMISLVRPPVLNILDAIWVSHLDLKGYPEQATYQAGRVLASQDPLALDYWGCKYVLHPIDFNPNHHPDNKTVRNWMAAAAEVINGNGGLYDPDRGLLVDRVTRREDEMMVLESRAAEAAALGDALPRRIR
jgi:hypothetical protein